MYKYLLISLLFCCAASDCLSAQERAVVSVLKIENKTNAPDSLFVTLRSRITDNIINTRKFEVVERERLGTVLSERGLSDVGLTNLPEGKLKSAAFVIYGSVLSFNYTNDNARITGLNASKNTANVEIQLRITNAVSGKILSSKTITASASDNELSGDGIARTGDKELAVIDEVLRSAAKKVTEALTQLAYPAKVVKVTSNEVVVNLTQEQTEIGSVYEVFSVGEEIIDPDTKESLGGAEEIVGLVEIIRTLPKYSYAKPSTGYDISKLTTGMTVRPISESVQNFRQNNQPISINKSNSRF